jgi:hypothetical protein
VQALPLQFHSPKAVQASSRQGFISRRDFKDEPRHHSASRRSSLFDDAKAENADEDQVQRDDVVQQPRHDENENAGNERDDGLKLADIDGHVFSPFRNGVENSNRFAVYRLRNRDFRRFRVANVPAHAKIFSAKAYADFGTMPRAMH